jgi:collagen triple helix repeat protein
MPHGTPRLARTALAAAAALVAAGGVGVATGAIPSSPGASPASNGVIHACYRRGSGNGRSSGSLRVIDFAAGVRCASSETLLSWNVQGQTGAAGAAGDQGTAGLRGADGGTGPIGGKGATGAQGVTGAVGVDGPLGLEGATGDTGQQGVTGDNGIQGQAGPTGDTGSQGLDGQTGAQGPKGDAGAAGAKGDTGAGGAKGDTGAAGAAGSGGGETLTDANGHVLGKVVSADGGGYGVTVATSTGYLLTLGWDGSLYPGQIYYVGTSAAKCSGTAYLNDGGETGSVISSKVIEFSGSENSMVVPATVSKGTSTSVAFGNVTGIDNPTCMGGYPANESGWQLTPLSDAAAGLPGSGDVPSITPPLTLG